MIESERHRAVIPLHEDDVSVVHDCIEKCLPGRIMWRDPGGGEPSGAEPHAEGLCDRQLPSVAVVCGALMDTGKLPGNPYDKMKHDRRPSGLRAGQGLLRRRRRVSLDSTTSAHRKNSREANYTGYVALEFEGKAPGIEAVPKSIAMLSKALTWREAQRWKKMSLLPCLTAAHTQHNAAQP